MEPEGESAVQAFQKDDLEFLSALMEKAELLAEARTRLAAVPLPGCELGEVLGDILQNTEKLAALSKETGADKKEGA